ncbi:MAG: hypothetical protein KDC83_09995 [Flavobacteriales bacterium]|nr:hypothetical protein [Flavobacteriales bacterium]
MKKYIVIALTAGFMASFATASLMANDMVTKTQITQTEKEKGKKDKKDKKSNSETTKSDSKAKSGCSGEEKKPGCCASKKAS